MRRTLLIESKPTESIILDFSVPTEKNDSFECEVSIKGAGINRIHKIIGGDALQAFFLTVRFAKTILENSDYGLKDQIYWAEPGDKMGLEIVGGVYV